MNINYNLYYIPMHFMNMYNMFLYYYFFLSFFIEYVYWFKSYPIAQFPINILNWKALKYFDSLGFMLYKAILRCFKRDKCKHNIRILQLKRMIVILAYTWRSSNKLILFYSSYLGQRSIYFTRALQRGSDLVSEWREMLQAPENGYCFIPSTK